MPDSSGLNVSQLQFAYPGEGFRLSLPRLELAAGQTLALAGPSGAGKSTLLRLLAGLLTPGTGQVCLGSAQIVSMQSEERRAFRLRHIGLVFQDFALLDYLTVTENILLPHQFRDGSAGTPVRQNMHDLTRRLQIDRYLDKRVSQLSQGERQRVAVARALVHEPRFIFADEPTASLDPSRGRIVVELLIEDARRRGACLIMVTHDPNLLPLFDRTLRMEELAAA